MLQPLTANETMVILEMGHGKHLDCSMFPNHLYNTERVFPNLIQVASLPLAFHPAASLPHGCPSYHPLQQFHRPCSISNFLPLCYFSSSVPFISQIMVAAFFFLAVSRYAFKSSVRSLLQFISLCSALCLTSFVPQNGWFLIDLKFSQNTCFKSETTSD